MNRKRIVQWMILIFVLISIGAFLNREVSENSGKATSTAKELDRESKVVVYYFHRTARCWSCRVIEAYVKEVLQERFALSLSKGELVFAALNVEIPANRHFIEGFKLSTISVVVAEFRNQKQTRWKKLDQIWNYVSAKGQLGEYLENEVKDYMESRG